MEERQWNQVQVWTNLLSSNQHFETTLGAQLCVRTPQNRIFKSKLRRVRLSWINFCHCTEKCFWDFVNVTIVWWVNKVNEDFSNHFQNGYTLVLFPCVVMCQNSMCFFFFNILTHWYFPIYKTSAASSDEMELRGS